MTPKYVLALMREKGAVAVDFKLVDRLGTWQHVTTPASELEGVVSDQGLGFDGSPIRGRQAINESDLLVAPDPSTAVIRPCPHEFMLCFDA